MLRTGSNVSRLWYVSGALLFVTCLSASNVLWGKVQGQPERDGNGGKDLASAIVTEHSGTLVEMRVESGDRVKNGDVLFELRDNDLDSQLARLAAEKRVAEGMLKVASSDADHVLADNLHNQVRVLRQQMEVLSRFRDALTVRSPIDGFVAVPDKRGVLGRGIPAGYLLAVVTNGEEQLDYLRRMVDVD